MQPKIMLFDEPTSALDPEMIKEVLDVMIELAKSGITMLVVTHEMGFARSVATAWYSLTAARFVEQGTPSQIFTQPQHDRTKLFPVTDFALALSEPCEVFARTLYLPGLPSQGSGPSATHCVITVRCSCVPSRRDLPLVKN